MDQPVENEMTIAEIRAAGFTDDQIAKALREVTSSSLAMAALARVVRAVDAVDRAARTDANIAAMLKQNGYLKTFELLETDQPSPE